MTGVDQDTAKTWLKALTPEQVHEAFVSLIEAARAVGGEHDRRVTELLAANNALVEQRRALAAQMAEEIQRVRDEAAGQQARAQVALTEMTDRCAEAHTMAGRLAEALREVVGCFDAAETEGLRECLNNLDEDEMRARMRDLLERRILFAKGVAVGALDDVAG